MFCFVKCGAAKARFAVYNLRQKCYNICSDNPFRHSVAAAWWKVRYVATSAVHPYSCSLLFVGGEVFA